VTSEFVWLTVQEFAQWQRLHIQTVYGAIRHGRLKYDVERATPRAIRIKVPRESIEGRKSA
jgi:hypothetical protein